MRRVVIVGGGLGGLRAAESLRSAGYSDAITIVGDEVYLPYNRPPLSKEALAGGIDFEGLKFRRKASVDDVEWLLGTPVAVCDLSLRTVTLCDGATLEFDGLVVASGIRPRRLPIPGPTGGRYALRTATDALAVREHLKPGAAVIIMGAGFIGCEVAATAIKLGCTVHVVALDEEPMVRPLGLELGAAMRRRHEAQGVRFHLGHTIAAFSGDADVSSATLSDGTELKADLVIEAVGSVANTEWLRGNDLDLSDGLLTDSTMQVPTTLAPVVAVGDLARHPNGLFGHVPRRIEHWNMPTETARRAGPTLAALLRGEEPDRSPFLGLPAFWSDQYETKLQSFGMPGIADNAEVTSGSVDEACIIEYFDASGLVGVVGVDRTAELAPYRKALLARHEQGR